jgi:hypothetical protein
LTASRDAPVVLHPEGQAGFLLTRVLTTALDGSGPHQATQRLTGRRYLRGLLETTLILLAGLGRFQRGEDAAVEPLTAQRQVEPLDFAGRVVGEAGAVRPLPARRA